MKTLGSKGTRDIFHLPIFDPLTTQSIGVTNALGCLSYLGPVEYMIGHDGRQITIIPLSKEKFDEHRFWRWKCDYSCRIAAWRFQVAVSLPCTLSVYGLDGTKMWDLVSRDADPFSVFAFRNGLMVLYNSYEGMAISSFHRQEILCVRDIVRGEVVKGFYLHNRFLTWDDQYLYLYSLSSYAPVLVWRINLGQFKKQRRGGSYHGPSICDSAMLPDGRIIVPIRNHPDQNDICSFLEINNEGKIITRTLNVTVKDRNGIRMSVSTPIDVLLDGRLIIYFRDGGENSYRE